MFRGALLFAVFKMRSWKKPACILLLMEEDFAARVSGLPNGTGVHKTRSPGQLALVRFRIAQDSIA